MLVTHDLWFCILRVSGKNLAPNCTDESCAPSMCVLSASKSGFVHELCKRQQTCSLYETSCSQPKVEADSYNNERPYRQDIYKTSILHTLSTPKSVIGLPSLWECKHARWTCDECIYKVCLPRMYLVHCSANGIKTCPKLLKKTILPPFIKLIQQETHGITRG